MKCTRHFSSNIRNDAADLHCVNMFALSSGSSVIDIVFYFASFMRGFVASVWLRSFHIGNWAAIQIAET